MAGGTHKKTIAMLVLPKDLKLRETDTERKFHYFPSIFNPMDILGKTIVLSSYSDINMRARLVYLATIK